MLIYTQSRVGTMAHIFLPRLYTLAIATRTLDSSSFTDSLTRVSRLEALGKLSGFK